MGVFRLSSSYAGLVARRAPHGHRLFHFSAFHSLQLCTLMRRRLKLSPLRCLDHRLLHLLLLTHLWQHSIMILKLSWLVLTGAVVCRCGSVIVGRVSLRAHAVRGRPRSLLARDLSPLRLVPRFAWSRES